MAWPFFCIRERLLMGKDILQRVLEGRWCLQGGNIGVIGAYVGFCDHYNVRTSAHAFCIMTCVRQEQQQPLANIPSAAMLGPQLLHRVRSWSCILDACRNMP